MKLMKWIVFLFTLNAHAALPPFKAKKVVLPNGTFRLEAPVVNVNGKDIPVGYRETFNGACRSQGGKYSLEVEQQRVIRTPLVNVNSNGEYINVSERNYIAKSITCKI